MQHERFCTGYRILEGVVVCFLVLYAEFDIFENLVFSLLKNFTLEPLWTHLCE